jgi:hypothetical protein
MQKSPIFGGEEFLREKFNFSTAWLGILSGALFLYTVNSFIDERDENVAR